MVRIEFSQFGGLILTFSPSKEGTDLALAIMEFLEDAVHDPVNKDIARHFIKVLRNETGELQ